MAFGDRHSLDTPTPTPTPSIPPFPPVLPCSLAPILPHPRPPLLPTAAAGSPIHLPYFQKRDAFLFIPNADPGGRELPLVFNYHGFGSNAGSQRTYSGMSTLAETEGFLVICEFHYDEA